MYSVRIASREDAASIQRIYNCGIESRQATFETACRSVEDIEAWFDDSAVVQGAYYENELVGFASISAYRERACYSGVGEFSIYVDAAHRGTGVGRTLMAGLAKSAKDCGYWKLLSRVFPENVPCRRLLANAGFREVGIYQRHAQLCGVWRDVVIVERLLTPET